MPDVIEVLRDADPVQLNRWSETDEGHATRDRVFGRSSKRPGRTALVAAVVVLAIVAGVFVVTRYSTETASRLATMTERLADGKWSKSSAGPASDLAYPAMFWTRDKLLVFGESPDGSGLASFDPRKSRWTRLADPPIGDRASPVWTGSELIVWADISPEDVTLPGAAYDPETNQWRVLPLAPIEAVPLFGPRTSTGSAAVWTGAEVVVIGGFRRCPDTGSDCSVPRAAAAFNPATDSWRLLPDADYPGGELKAVWDGRRVVVWGSRRGDPATLAYKPSENRWVERPASRVFLNGAVLTIGGSPMWVGMEVGALAGEGLPGIPVRALVLDELGWHDLAPPLRERSICPTVAARVGRSVVALCGRGDRSAALDLQTHRWTVIPPPPTYTRGVVWTGEELLALGGDALLRFRPAR